MGYFPAPYEDELLYSLVSRYALHAGLVGNQKAVVREVFSSSTAVAVPDLPSHLDALVKNLQLVWPISVIKLINSFTLAPIYLPFLSQAQATKIVGSMRSDSGGDIHTRSGIAASAIKPQEYFRYCPECIKEQLPEVGEYYWRRVDQLPGIEFCVRHSCSLEYSTINFHPKEKHLFVAAIEAKLDMNSRPIKLTGIEKTLHDRYVELLQEPELKGLGVNRWTLFYRNLAAELGLMHKSRVKHKEIHRLLKQRWAGTTFEGQFQMTEDHYWLRNLFRKHRKSFHPLRHLLVTTALVPQWSVEQILENVRRLPDRPLQPSSTRETVIATMNEINEHRAGWIDMLNQYPDAGVKALRSMDHGGAIYAWLYRNDRQWLMFNSPAKIIPRNNHYTIDYQNWDESNVAFLESTYDEMATAPNRKRLSRARFIKELPRSNSVEKHLQELPKTAQWVASHEESFEGYQLYRLRVAYEQIKAENLEVKRWRLLRFASVRKELVTQKIEAIESL